MKKSIAMLMAVVLMLCFGVTGCQSAGENTSGDGHEPLTLLSLNIDQSAFTAALEENCPGVGIEFISYTGGNGTGYSQYLLDKGHPPDIYTISVFGMQDKQKEYLLDLSGYEFLNNYNTVDINQVTLDGSVYMLPSSAAIMGLYYNKTMFAEHGWEVPQNFEEFMALVKVIREAGIDPAAAQFKLPGNGFFDLFTMAKTGFLSTPEGRRWEQDFKNGDATASEGLSAAVEALQELIDCGFLDAEDTTRSSSETTNYFYDRGAAMYLNAGTIPRYTQNEDGTGDEYGIMPFYGPGTDNMLLIQQPQRYFGLSKELAEPGNEQKLEDALRVMEFLSTQEGQTALLSKKDNYVPPLKNSLIPEDSPFYEVEQAIRQGYVSTLAYAGYEPIIIGVGNKVRDWVQGKCTGADVLACMDELQAEYLSTGMPVEGTAACDFTHEETVQLQAEAIRLAAETDFAMISMGVIRGGKENMGGACGQIFEGDIGEDALISLLPNYCTDALSVLTLSGADITGLLETGLVTDGGTEGFPYIPAGLTAEMKKDGTVKEVTLPDGSPLDENASYIVAFNKKGFNDEIRQIGNARETDIPIIDAVRGYMSAHTPLTPLEPSVKRP